jgi:hypothetical protein
LEVIEGDSASGLEEHHSLLLVALAAENTASGHDLWMTQRSRPLFLALFLSR